MTPIAAPLDLTPYQRIVDRCTPYLVARPPVARDLDPAPLGLGPAGVLDPQRVANGPFLKLVERLDELTYGPSALRMPSWVFYDCALMPGAVFGFARPAAELPPWVHKTLQVPPDYEGLVPLSHVTVIPMASRRTQLVSTLASINQVAPGGAPEGLWRLTLAAGSAALRLREVVATTQWRSALLGLFASLGPLALQTAWTPAHDIWATTTFSLSIDVAARARLLAVGAGPTWKVDRYLDADDRPAMQALQHDIELGMRVWVVGPAEIRGAETRIPLAVDALVPLGDAQPAGFLPRFQG